jgi:hypothetical protein
MSHFAVIVVGDNVDAQLGPYNEQPVAGDPYVSLVFEDKTDEYRAKYATASMDVWRLPDGNWLHGYQSQPEGAVKEQLLCSEAYPTFEQFCLEWYGATANAEGRFGYFHNPSAKWDWYMVGGRWTGYFKLKPGATGRLGTPGVFGDPAPAGTADSACVGDIDFDGMAEEARARAAETYNKYEQAVAGIDVPPLWSVFQTQHPSVDAARKAYHDLPYIQALRAAGLLPGLRDPVVVYGCGREEYLRRAGVNAYTPYAVLKNGHWLSIGDMGWFGMSHDKVSKDDWCVHVDTLLRSLPSDTLLTVVDCHI